MQRLSIFLSLALCFGVSPVKAETIFYGLDKAFDPNPMRLVQFNSNPGNPAVVELSQVPGLPAAPVGVNMDLSNTGRLFAAPSDMLNTIFEIDPVSGVTLGSFAVPGVSGAHINGLAVADTGQIYISQEIPGGGKFWVVDFDAQQASSLINISFDIDNIDFDSAGDLIGNDINATGRLFRIPLDGSAVQLIATLPVSDTPNMTYSESDLAFYFKDTSVRNNGRGLWRLPWFDGLPAGPLEYVKDIGSGHYVGFTAIPEPSAALLLLAGGVIALRRRRPE